MDKVFIQGLSLESIIGIYDWEREKTQPLILDIEMEGNFSQAIKTDRIDSCIDYAKVSEELTALAGSHSFQLLESFGQAACDLILNHYPVNKVSIKINKPEAVANAQAVGIIMERSASERLA